MLIRLTTRIPFQIEKKALQKDVEYLRELDRHTELLEAEEKRRLEIQFRTLLHVHNAAMSDPADPNTPLPPAFKVGAFSLPSLAEAGRW